MKKKMYVFILLGLLCVSQFPIEASASVDPLNLESKTQPQPRQEIDHKTDKKKAEEWAKKKYQEFEEKISSEEKNAIKSVLVEKKNNVEQEQLNHHLQYFGGSFDSWTPPSGSQFNRLKGKYEQEMKHMDEAFKAGKDILTETTYVYKNLSLSQILNNEFSHPAFDFESKIFGHSINHINRDMFMDFKNDFEYGLFSSYITTNIADEPASNPYERIKLRIRVPAGTPSAYGGGDTLILDKNHGFEVKDMSIITQNGKEYIRVNVDLVDKKKINERVAPAQQEARDFINERFGLDPSSASVDFNFYSMSSSMSVKSLNEEIKKTIDLMDEKVANHIFEALLSKGDGKLVFTDISIWALRGGKTKWSSLDELTHGLTNYLEGIIYVRTTHSLVDYSDDDSLPTIHETLLHESGHVLDFITGGWSPEEDAWYEISDSAEFISIFEEEREELTAYASTSQHEFFAEAFRMYYVSENSRNDLEMGAPRTFDFLTRLIHYI